MAAPSSSIVRLPKVGSCSCSTARTMCGTPEWYTYWAEAPDDARIILEAEHDRYVWLAPHNAVQRCAPEAARVALARVVALLDPQHGHHALG